jgi:GDSL-like Lipase/Acylhydrolase
MPNAKRGTSRRLAIDPPLLLAVGDSIVWGQGLLKENKFCYTVADELRSQLRAPKTLTVQNRAHSGATVLAGNGPDDQITGPGYCSPVDASSGKESATGEIPRSKPTILEQAVFFDGDTEAVRYIIVDGGINDVGIFNIVSPFSTKKDLEQSVAQHCFREMTFLLKYIASKFANRDCKIRVIGYFPILSEASSRIGIAELHLALGIPPIPPVLWPNSPIELAMDFWHKSDAALAMSVDEADDRRIVFVQSGFSEKNALFAGDTTFLREPVFASDHPEYPVEDKVYEARKKVCDRYPQDPQNCALCPIASLGHPIEGGAQKYSEAILATL